ncbi:aminopeptidase P family protein [Halomonas sp. GXIMD04776]|uniref:aminopeptidase P family protein n=1 Tax=Halomonas sp. GXIMD04776 TaxID=3415605 RepID=UPI003CB5A519
MSHSTSFSPAERLAALREVMRQHAIDAWWLPSSDPHSSEYLPEHWEGRAWLSGFDGSVGILTITQDVAGLWVDSRYWVQAEQQLEGSGIELKKLQQGQAQAPIEWLAEQLPQGATLGFDADVVSLANARRMEEMLLPRGVKLHSDLDLLDMIWPNRPALPQASVYEHPREYVTGTRHERLAELRKALRESSADWHLLSTLDDIAWLTQLRGSDVDFNPVFLAHMLIGHDSATLFIAPGKLKDDLAEMLRNDGIDIADYDQWKVHLAKLPVQDRVLLDGAKVSLATAQALPESMTLYDGIQPTTLTKSRKSESDIAHVRRTMEEDGAALCEFFAEFEAALERGETPTELDVDERLTAQRAKREGFVCQSFGTIAAFNENGALPHYHATDKAHATIQGDGLLLIDSGGQYYGGTTDITRVIPIGEISATQREDFTRVLKGTIALSRTHYPEGIASPKLDAIARAPLWSTGRDYGHGTGHGVGYFLNVHEGPQVIAYSATATEHNTMREGMITSIEPGVYRPGKWGVRIENLVVNRHAPESEFGEFLHFETLTLCPIDTRCIDRDLLDQSEIDWLNTYHKEVRERLAPKLSQEARSWLEERTKAI